jgi:heptosyltransferase-2
VRPPLHPIGRYPIRRLLVRGTNWIGDAVMATPAIRAIRAGLPDARIGLLVKPWVAPVFAASPHVDEIIVYRSAGRHRATMGTLRLAADLRRMRFDAAILLQNAFEAAFLARAAGIPLRAGFGTDGRSLLLTHPVHRRHAIMAVHQTRYYLEMLNGLGIRGKGTRLELPLSEQAVASAHTLLKARGIERRELVVGINPSATYGSAKQWFPERFAQLADRLIENHGARILIFGGPDDRRLGDRVAALMKGAAVDLSGRIDLETAMALIARCQLFVTNDSGLMHVAAALERPLVAIFGSTDAVTTGPLGNRSRIVRVPVHCSPCLRPFCPIDHRCMSLITVERVAHAAAALLAIAEGP